MWNCEIIKNLPQILNGASSSSNIGCCKNISRDFKHKPLTSCSVICTDLPGRHLRTVDIGEIDEMCAKTKIQIFIKFNSTEENVVWFKTNGLISSINLYKVKRSLVC